MNERDEQQTLCSASVDELKAELARREAQDISLREQHIRDETRKQIIYYLRDAADGSELLMKEVWENCCDENECTIANDEVARMIAELS